MATLSFRDQFPWRGLAGLLIAILAIVGVGYWFFFREEPKLVPAKPDKVAQVPAPAASAKKAASAPSTVPNQLALGTNPTVDTPVPAKVQESEQPAKVAQAPAPAASQPPAVKPEVKEETKQPPAEKQKAAPRTRTAVAIQQPDSAHKATMGNAGGFVKVSSVAPVYYSSKEQCIAMQSADRAAMYHPTMKSKDYGPARIAGLTLRGGEAPACARMDTAAGIRWVAFEQGREFLTRGAEVVYLAECQNKIHEIVFIRKEEPVAVLPPAQPAPPAELQNTSSIEETIRKDITVERNVFCKNPADGTRTPAVIQNGKSTCPDLEIVAPTTVNQPTRVQPHVVQGTRPAQPAAVPQQPMQPQSAQPQGCVGAGCTLHFNTESVAPRSDGRCVVAFRNDTNQWRFVRFETMRGSNILHGAKVDSVAGEWNRSYELVPIGRNENGRDRAVYMPQPSCPAIVRALNDPGVLDRVGPRLGLTKTCRPVRSV